MAPGWLAVKIEEGPVLVRTRTIARIAAIASMSLFMIGGVMVAGAAWAWRCWARWIRKARQTR
jgi:hypothetical protein